MFAGQLYALSGSLLIAHFYWGRSTDFLCFKHCVQIPLLTYLKHTSHKEHKFFLIHKNP